MRRRDFLASAAVVVAVPVSKLIAEALDAERHFLYVVEPGIRNYVSYGGVGILVYDIDQGYTFVRRKRIIALNDETGRQIGSEKLLEVVMDGHKVTRAGDQFGIGMKK